MILLNALLFISIKGILGIILLVGLMFLATRKLFTVGWKGMKKEERMLAIISLLFLSIALLIVCIIVFN